MAPSSEQILSILDGCCGSFTFPALDNGYVYLAATRLSLFRSPQDWAMVFEVFGFSPRTELPDLQITTFSSRLHNRDVPGRYVSREAYDNYIAKNPFNESRFFFPLDEGDWQNQEDLELVALDAKYLTLRGRTLGLPSSEDYEPIGIKLAGLPRVAVFELCRYLAQKYRDDVLATDTERRVSVAPGLTQILTLDEWFHPDVSAGDVPSGSPTFQKLARVLETGVLETYQPIHAPNTHWRNWPHGGTL